MLSVVLRNGEMHIERLWACMADQHTHRGERSAFFPADGFAVPLDGRLVRRVKFDGRQPAIETAARRAVGQGGTKLCSDLLWCAPIGAYRRVSATLSVCTALAGPSRTKRANRCRFALFLQNVSVEHQVRRAASFSCSFSRNSSSSSASGLTGSSSCSAMVGAAPRLPRSLPNRCSRA